MEIRDAVSMAEARNSVLELGRMAVFLLRMKPRKDYSNPGNPVLPLRFDGAMPGKANIKLE